MTRSLALTARCNWLSFLLSQSKAQDMVSTKTIVCLANSKKYSHRCVAGKELQGNRIGGWIRPVTERANCEVSLDEISFQDGSVPQLLDIVAVPLLQHSPHSYQTENYLIDGGYYWVKKGVLSVADLPKFCDDTSTLWINGHHSFNGYNDAIPLEVAETQLHSSLFLIRPSSLCIHVATEKYGRKVRAAFSFRQQRYKLAVTDPLVEQHCLRGNDGIFRLDNRERYFCVSLGEPYKGFCYKLVAAIIPFL
jgi:hypothetical protein